MRLIRLLIQNASPEEPIDSLLNLDIGETIDKIENTPFQVLIQDTTHWLLQFSLKLAACLLLIWLGKKAIGALSRFLGRMIDRRRVDRTAGHFLVNLLQVFLWLIVVWIVISIIGIDTSSVIALFASAGLAFGLALSGTLQNFAGGVMILLFKPFRTGDYIASQGEEGTVDQITIINTVLITPDNRTIYLPNGPTFTGIVRNTSQQHTRRVEWTFTVSVANSYDQARELLSKLLAADSRILREPAPFIAVSKLTPSTVDVVVRVWVKTEDYWGVFYDLNEAVYRTFPANSLTPPAPQMEVYLHRPTDEGDAGDAADAPQPPAASPKAAAVAVAEAKTELMHSEHHCDASAKPSGGES